MSEFDEILSGQENESPKEKPPFDSLKWAEQKQQTRKAAYDLIDTTAEEIGRDSNKFRSYLDVQSHFDRYSIGNALLVTAQNPKATQLRDFDSWKEAGASVKKGEAGIMILEPGEKYTREDGSVGVSMNVKRVFDIAQTSAEPQPDAPKPDDRTLLKALVGKALVKIEPVDQMTNPENKAFFDPTQQTVFVQRGMDTPDIFRAVTKEMALADFASKVPEYSRRKEHFKAQCVSYILCNKYGIDTKEMEIRVPASYSGMNAQDIRAELTDIHTAANDMIARMSKTLEQNKSSRVTEQER